MSEIIKRILEDGKHWFHSDDIDLYFWLKGEEIIEFQLTYDKLNSEKMVHWKQLPDSEKLSHCAVDSGEDDPNSNLSPMVRDVCSPIESKLQQKLLSLHWPMSEAHLAFFLEKLAKIPHL